MYTRSQMLTAMNNPKIFEHGPDQTPETFLSSDGFKPLLDADRNVVEDVRVDEYNRMKFTYKRK